VKIVGELEGQDWVRDLVVLHLFHVLLRGHLPGDLGVARYTATGDDRAQVQLLAEFLARVIQAPPQAQPPVIRVHEDVHPVQRVAIGIVRGQEAVAGDLPVAVVIAEAPVFDDQADRRGHHLAVILDADLTLGETRDLGSELILTPGTVQVRVDPFHDLADVRVVLQAGLAKREVMRGGSRLRAIGHRQGQPGWWRAPDCRPG
jgi:hypothetical protein